MPNKNNKAITSLILGIAGLLLVVVLPPLGLLCGIGAIIFYFLQKKPKGVAVAGLVTGIIGTILNLILTAILLYAFIWLFAVSSEPKGSVTLSEVYVSEEVLPPLYTERDAVVYGRAFLNDSVLSSMLEDVFEEPYEDRVAATAHKDFHWNVDYRTVGIIPSFSCSFVIAANGTLIREDFCGWNK